MGACVSDKIGATPPKHTTASRCRIRRRPQSWPAFEGCANTSHSPESISARQALRCLHRARIKTGLPGLHLKPRMRALKFRMLSPRYLRRFLYDGQVTSMPLPPVWGQADCRLRTNAGPNGACPVCKPVRFSDTIEFSIRVGSALQCYAAAFCSCGCTLRYSRTSSCMRSISAKNPETEA